MTQQMIKIGTMTVQNAPARNLLETGADTSNAGGLVTLDTTVGGVTNNTEVLRIIVADNAVLDADNLAQTLQYLRHLASDEDLFREIIQA